MRKNYWEHREAQAEKTYNKTVKQYMLFLQKEYKKALKQIETEIAMWLAKKEEILATTPNFKFAELKMAQDLEKQINIILNNLAEKEIDKLGDTLMEFYEEDILNFDKMMKEYQLEGINARPEFNNLLSHTTLNALEKTSLNSSASVAKFLSPNVWNNKLPWYKPIADGIWFDTRVRIRAEKVQQVLSEELKLALIRGDGYNKVAGTVAKKLDVSFSSAKTLVQNELRIAENQAHIDSAKKNGFTHFRAGTIHDDKVCLKCQENEKKIYSIDDYEPTQLHPHVNCRCVFIPVMVDENGKVKRSQYYEEAQAFIKDRTKEIDERAKKIREQYYLSKKQNKK